MSEFETLLRESPTGPDPEATDDTLDASLGSLPDSALDAANPADLVDQLTAVPDEDDHDH